MGGKHANYSVYVGIQPVSHNALIASNRLRDAQCGLQAFHSLPPPSPPDNLGAMTVQLTRRPVPPRALVLSLAALTVPVVGALTAPASLSEYSALLWLLALVPAFLLAYYRGWRGVATALAAGMATLSLTQVVVLWMGRAVPDILLGVVIAYLALSLGIGWMAERLHRERAIVEDMAFTDLLTRLPNRRHARAFLDNEFAAAERGRLLSVVLFDLDHFKSYNDQWGHAAGDDALRTFANIVEPSTRRMDLSARFGGEEFLSVLTSTDTEGALIFADRIRSALATMELDGGRHLTVSAGIATYHPSMRSPDELIAAADEALYQAKRAGRNRVRLFGDRASEEVSEAATRRLERMARGESPDDAPAGDEVGRRRPSPTLLPPRSSGFGTGRRALVVEDDAQVRALLTSYLGREGFYVSEAVNVASGLETMSIDYDVVISDLRLPGVPGTELVAAVKSRWPATQVLVITGLHDDKIAADALNAGADRYLLKPLSMPDLRRHLVEALEHRDLLLGDRSARRAPSRDGGNGKAPPRESVLAAVRALAIASEEHDRCKLGHGRRVAEYAVRIADELDPGQELIPRSSLRLACEIHDLGKIAVAQGVLGKVGQLDATERAAMREHPVIGRRILERLVDDPEVLSVVMWHHERWDGTGYPDGLAGEAIPLAVRVVAVSDALDAMTCDRAYRSARSWDDAVRELQKKAGHQFDPRVVDAMEHCVEDLREIFLERPEPEGEPTPS